MGESSGKSVILVKGVEKSYGNNPVLRGVSLEVRQGEIFTIVGPNGSGKTTIMEILEGTRTFDRGSFTVLGSSPGEMRVRERIGVALQDADAFSNLRIDELLSLHKSFYKKSLPVDELIKKTGLDRLRRSSIRNLSGGERQRLNLAVAMVNDPDLLFLDEPSEGLDPRVRIEFWGILKAIRNSGKTILLTTHYMEEAERLSDRVAVLGRGKILSIGHPAALIASMDLQKHIEFEFDDAIEPLLSLLNGDYNYSMEGNGHLTFYSMDVEADLLDLLSKIRSVGLSIRNLDIRSPGLEDVYLQLTEDTK